MQCAAHEVPPTDLRQVVRKIEIQGKVGVVESWDGVGWGARWVVWWGREVVSGCESGVELQRDAMRVIIHINTYLIIILSN